MSMAYDVPADVLIEKLAHYLKENVSEISPPKWATFSKTGSYTERLPEKTDWWYTRGASVLRKIYINGPIGILKLRLAYGGRTGQRSSPEHFRRGSGAVVRKLVQQLEAANLVTKASNKGRVVTKEGKDILDSLANEVKRVLEKRLPELKKYE